ncbi:uncharacterized protein LOC124619310 [Schistocerca americana]|uniref:uncharacterized protein LOC124619310 n=1 Tax=Schistocerca americana TaxID=7009 RepID=UPI001F5017FC|nr:uncharacterized protein LOC124619310 [Schistocerca americana]
MGISGLFGFVVKGKFYKVVDLQKIAEEFKKKSGEDPVIAVDGSACMWHIYEPLDFLRGGQYKKFRDYCANFVQRFRDNGIRLVFFFHGVPVEDEIHTWTDKKKDKTMFVSNLFGSLRLGIMRTDSNLRTLPEAVIPAARVIFKDLGCRVYLSKGNCKHDIAKYISGTKHCIGVLTNDSDFFAMKGVSSVLTFRNLEKDGKLKTYQFRPVDIATHLGIEQEHMPTFATFVGNDFVRADLLFTAHGNLKKRYPEKTTNIEQVAEMMKDEDPCDVVNMCKIVFHGKWRDALPMVEAGIRSYSYEPTSWEKLVAHVEDKHGSGEIPGTLLSVMKRQVFRIGEVLEDLSETKQDFPPTSLVLRPMRARMYTVLLWESDCGLCRVTEYLLTETGKVRKEEVELEKRLPDGLEHPGLQQLWISDDAQRRWCFFTWLVAPYAKPSLLEELDPQFLVVPAAALLFLKHEARVLHDHEVTAFCATAAAVAGLPATGQPANIVKTPDERAVYLASLFMRCVLHVLDAAATCGIAFPREIDCLPDAYFDGIVFHNICVTTRNGKDPRTLDIFKPQHEVTFEQLMRVIKWNQSKNP